MLQKENIPIEEAPKKVTQRMLLKHRFSGSLKKHDGSPIKLMSYLFPNVFSVEQFHTKPNGYWKNVENVKAAIIQLVETNGISEEDIPTFITKKRLMQEGLGGMLSEYNGSPIEIIHAVFPGKYDVTQFQRVPNEYWHSQANREQALRDFCQKRNIKREQLPLLNRAYFRKHFPRFISLVDRYYDSKFYRWIMESFPEYTFTPQEFRLFVGMDGQICDSQEELAIHNFLVQNIDGEVKREGQRFTNHINGEVYIPDWIIYQQGCKWIIEYFGLYGSGRYKGYTEKAHRKINFFQSLEDYEFIAIMPECFRVSGFCNIMSLLSKNGLYLRYNGNI